MLTAAGLAGAVLAGWSRAAARDPKYTVRPQRERLREPGEPAT